MIRKATFEDIDAILKVTKSCAKLMIKKDIYQWNEHYPNALAFENDVKRGELYVLDKDKTVIGCIVISTYMDEEYIPIKWLTPSESNIYIHRLAIHPTQQGKGYAQKLMDFAEKWSKDKDNKSIRLDTFSQNKRNQEFYKKRGYQRLGEIYFLKQSEYPFFCYELIL